MFRIYAKKGLEIGYTISSPFLKNMIVSLITGSFFVLYGG
jgi:hypothetical protein